MSLTNHPCFLGPITTLVLAQASIFANFSWSLESVSLLKLLEEDVWELFFSSSETVKKQHYF